MKRQELIRELREAGCELLRHGARKAGHFIRFDLQALNHHVALVGGVSSGYVQKPVTRRLLKISVEEK